MKARVALAAVEAGASIVNDVWGFQRDPDMARVVADTGAAAVLMHNRQTVDPTLDVIADVLAFLSRSIDIALAAGVDEARLILDPGFGFGKTPEQNFTLSVVSARSRRWVARCCSASRASRRSAG